MEGDPREAHELGDTTALLWIAAGCVIAVLCAWFSVLIVPVFLIVPAVAAGCLIGWLIALRRTGLLDVFALLTAPFTVAGGVFILATTEHHDDVVAAGASATIPLMILAVALFILAVLRGVIRSRPLEVIFLGTALTIAAATVGFWVPNAVGWAFEHGTLGRLF